MIYKKLLAVLFLMLSAFNILNAQKVIESSEKIKPQWIKSTISIPRGNDSYEYKLVENEGFSLGSLKESRLHHLGTFLQQTNKIDGVAERTSETVNVDSEINTHTIHKLSFKTATSIKEFACILVDDYWEAYRSYNGELVYRYYTLYAVSTPGEVADFDEFSTTTFYGARGLWRSAIVPGWGQFHKGSYVKGGLILGGTAVLIGGIVATETVRTDYVRRIGETHNADYKRLYAKRADQFSMARNICIGALGALYVYNLIDAIAAPGARRVVVKEKKTSGSSWYSYNITPASPDGMSIGMAFNLTF